MRKAEVAMSNWKVYTLEDSYVELPDPVWAVEDMFQIPSVNLIYGAPGSLKSMAVLDMVMCNAIGKPWLQNFNGAPSFNTTKTGVLWVDLDNGMYTVRRRNKAIGAHHKVPADGSFRYVGAYGLLDMHDLNHVEDLKACLDDNTGIVVIDNLGYVSGNVDENSHDMQYVMGVFRRIAEDYGICFNIIHHSRKGDGKGVRVGELIRGSSSIEGGLDFALYVDREMDGHTKTDRISMVPAKVRNSDLVTPFGAYWRYKKQEKRLVEGWFEGRSLNGSGAGVEMTIIRFLGTGEKGFEEIKSECKAVCGVGEPKVKEAIGVLLRAGKIVEKTGRSNKRFYSLKDAQLAMKYSSEIEANALIERADHHEI